MASLAKLIEIEPNQLITVVKKPATKTKEAITVQMRVQDLAEDLQVAFSKPEMSELLNVSGDRKGHHRAILDKAVANFEAMTTHEYRVHLEEGKKRRAYKQELDEPHENLFAREKLHAGSKLYKRYALVLWIATGYYGYAAVAGYTIKYTRLGRTTISTVLDEAFTHEKELLDAMSWWESADRRKDIIEVLKAAKNHVKGIVYKDTKKELPRPYIEWEMAANSVLGMRAASGDSAKSARRAKYGKDLRPDEKAQFIRDYIKAEDRLNGVVNSDTVRDVRDICLKIEKSSKKYPLFDTEKTQDIILTLRRSDFTRVTERQFEYLSRVLQDIEDYKELKSKRKVGEDLFDVDKFFDSITGEV